MCIRITKVVHFKTNCAALSPVSDSVCLGWGLRISFLTSSQILLVWKHMMGTTALRNWRTESRKQRFTSFHDHSCHRKFSIASSLRKIAKTTNWEDPACIGFIFNSTGLCSFQISIGVLTLRLYQLSVYFPLPQGPWLAVLASRASWSTHGPSAVGRAKWLALDIPDQVDRGLMDIYSWFGYKGQHLQTWPSGNIASLSSLLLLMAFSMGPWTRTQQ